MSFKPSVLVQGEWATNALVFATKEEAESSAQSLFVRWTLCQDHKAIEATDPVNYHLDLHTGAVTSVLTQEVVA